MKKIILTLLVAFVLVGVASCTTPTEPKVEQKITVSFAGDPETIDPALCSTVDASVICMNAFAGLYGYSADAKGAPVVGAACAKEVVKPVANGDGTYTYTIELKEGLKWSNGEALKASDFVYAWNRAAAPSTGADYGFLYEVMDGYEERCEDETKVLNCQANDDLGVITITTGYYCAYFDQLLAFPAFFPVCKSVVEKDDKWATKVDTYVTNGAFKMKTWTVGSEIVFEKNANYFNANKVKLETLTFFLSEDDDAVFANYTSGTIQYTTHVPVTQIPVLKNDKTRYGVDFFIGDYIGTWFLEFNVNQSFKPGLQNAGQTEADWKDWTDRENAEVRYALGLLIDRNYIVNQVTGGGQLPAYGFVPAGMSDGNGNVFRDEADDWWSVDSADYEANCEEAVNILKKYYAYDETTKKFTNFPKFDVKMNATTGNVAILTAVQNMWAKFGIEFEMDSRAWSILTTEVTAGNFTASRMGWIADYNDPVNFLEIYDSKSGNNHPQLGKDGIISASSELGPNHNQSWADYDALLVAIKTETDVAKRAELMYQAEQWLKAESPVLPIYYYTNPYLCDTKLKGFLYSTLGWVLFTEAYLEA